MGVVFFFPIHVVRFSSDQLILVGLSLCIFFLLFLSSLLVINIFLLFWIYIYSFSIFSIIISLSIGTLLSCTTLAWFASLLEKNSHLLNKFEEFISNFKACFGYTDSIRTTINKIRRLRQGDRSASTYATEFRLLATYIP